MRVELFKFPYAYMDYEDVLLRREIESLFPNTQQTWQSGTVMIDVFDDSAFEKLSRLTYISSYKVDDNIQYTYQHRFENGNAGSRDDMGKKQSTRYSTHGLHEYKGKYNPQIVRAIMNIIGIDSEGIVLDPFCGSGTTMLECLHVGVSAVGTDINPFAVFVSNVKLNSIKLDCTEAKNVFYRIRDLLIKDDGNTQYAETNDKRYIYLKKWIPEKELSMLEKLLSLTNEMETNLSGFLRITASDLIRDYSLQEPSDLRIRRRISPYPETSFIDAWEKNVLKYLHNISVIQKYYIPAQSKNFAVELDIRNAGGSFNYQFEAAITSPPYATALPYIDTQRISLVWLGLCLPEDIMSLESSLIGSRELYKLQKSLFFEQMLNNSAGIPHEIYTLITEMQSSISDSDGFRRQVVPLLLYRYFCDMRESFKNIHPLIKNNGYYCLIVGHNKSTLGGRTFQIDTPTLLAKLASTCGWNACELLPLQTYKRYGLNSKNSINHETLLILQKAEA